MDRPISGETAWLEEVSDEYCYRIAITRGGGTPLAPPDDYWVVAAVVGYVASPLDASWCGQGPDSLSGLKSGNDAATLTNHSQELLVALRDVAGLAWGGGRRNESQ